MEDLDHCTISITKDLGIHWILLEDYYYDSDNLIGNQSFDISTYSNEEVMFKFTLTTNENVVGLGTGWIVSDIYVGYDKNTDFIAPTVKLLKPLNNERLHATITIEANVSDNKALDLSRFYIYINNKVVNKELINYNQNSSILSFTLDTTDYSDGKYEIKIRVYDLEGNAGEQLVQVYIENGLLNMKRWGPWITLAVVALVIGIILFLLYRKKDKIWGSRMRDMNAEKIRLKDIDKEQIIKRIELFESNGTANRPLILHCKFCKSWFESNRFNYICPVCEHDQIYAAYNCLNCRKWYFKDEPGDNYYCPNKKCKGIKLVRREIEEVKEILGNKGTFLREFHQRKSKFSILD